MINYMPHVRWLAEYREAIARAPLSRAERRGCEALLRTWAYEHRRELMREPMQVAVRFCGLRPWTGGSRFGPPAAASSRRGSG
jgi:hypothetical protein